MFLLIQNRFQRIPFLLYLYSFCRTTSAQYSALKMVQVGHYRDNDGCFHSGPCYSCNLATGFRPNSHYSDNDDYYLPGHQYSCSLATGFHIILYSHYNDYDDFSGLAFNVTAVQPQGSVHTVIKQRYLWLLSTWPPPWLQSGNSIRSDNHYSNNDDYYRPGPKYSCSLVTDSKNTVTMVIMIVVLTRPLI